MELAAGSGIGDRGRQTNTWLTALEEVVLAGHRREAPGPCARGASVAQSALPGNWYWPVCPGRDSGSASGSTVPGSAAPGDRGLAEDRLAHAPAHPQGGR